MGIKPLIATSLCSLFLCTACVPRSDGNAKIGVDSRASRATHEQLAELLKNQSLSDETRYAIVNSMAKNMLSVKDYTSLILFLTDWVETHPQDMFNSWWLLMTAYAYLESNASPIAEYYLERIIRDYPDLSVQGTSVHFLCLQHLIQISRSSANRISYFNQLITNFPNDVSRTEMYLRLAREYEQEGDWNQAVKSYTLFLEQEDATTIQIAGIPNAYVEAKQLIDFNNSSKDWTFETLDALVAAVKNAISTYNWQALDRYKSKVNFFTMSWRQDETGNNSLANFSMRSFMVGNRIRYNAELDSMSSPWEAYLRTTGWSNYVNIWYLYFRKVNFPADPDIHGRWEWAGIYLGEKL
ncbi:MAG: tetratricopeptide repeat protein [Treponema sp.]|nr:tetratricopeptide repeat protein [Treponema sp.]